MQVFRCVENFVLELNRSSSIVHVEHDRRHSPLNPRFCQLSGQSVHLVTEGYCILFFSIMMLSVLKHTKTPVKFWFLKNYLSSGFMVRLNEFLCLFTTSQLDIFLICILRRTKTLRKIDVSQSVILRRTKVSFVYSLHLPNARPVFFFLSHTQLNTVCQSDIDTIFFTLLTSEQHSVPARLVIYLSYSFQKFLPTYAEKFGFEYELVQYQWPKWLNGQTEKQRIIWG